MRDCSKQLCKYILICPKVEIPNQEHLVSIFLEGLLNKKLHATLYPKKHKTLNAYIKDAIELNNNVNEFRYGRPMGLRDSRRSEKSSKLRVIAQKTQPIDTTPQVPTAQEVANAITRQMNVNNRTPLRIEPLRQQAAYPHNPTP